jgi:hypothetical protein
MLRVGRRRRRLSWIIKKKKVFVVSVGGPPRVHPEKWGMPLARLSAQDEERDFGLSAHSDAELVRFFVYHHLCQPQAR